MIDAPSREEGNDDEKFERMIALCHETLPAFIHLDGRVLSFEGIRYVKMHPDLD